MRMTTLSALPYHPSMNAEFDPSKVDAASGKRMSIQDVAKAAGVSMKTVSRVLNHEPNVTDDTREKVEQAVRALNYRPHPSARSLAGNRSYLIALLYNNPSPSYVMEILSGVLHACEASHYNMMLLPLDFDSREMVRAVEGLVLQSRPDGLILTPPVTDDERLLERLEELEIPYASISPRSRRNTIGVSIDEHSASVEMTAHLLALGHRRIAHIKGHFAHGASVWRFNGYREALSTAGIEFDPTLVVEGAFSYESGVACARQLLALSQPPTAIFAANDDMAAGVIRAASEKGLRVPEQLSVCGFDDTPIASQIYHSATSTGNGSDCG